MNEEELPLYEVEELSLEDAILLIATEQERQQADFRQSSERLLLQMAS